VKLALIAALIAWFLAQRKRPERLLAYGFPALPAVLSVLIIAFYEASGLLLYSSYSKYSWGDIGAYLSAFRTSTGWLPGLNNQDCMPHLAHHSEFLLIPLGWIYKLAPYPATIQLAQAAASVIGWMLFRSWIRRRSEDKAAAEWIAFGFALSTCTVAALLRGFHGSGLALPALVLTATAYHDKAWRKYLWSLILLLMMKETFTFTAIALGGFALLQRRDAKWILVPAALGLAYGMVLRFWFFPMMLDHGAYFYTFMLPGPMGILRNLASADSGLYLLRMALWAGCAWAFRSPYALLAIPPLLLNLALGEVFVNHQRHYSIEPAFWLYFAASLVMIERRIDARRLYAVVMTMLLMNATLLQTVPYYRRHPLAASYEAILARLPTDATVALGAGMDDQMWKIKRYYLVRYGGYGDKEPCSWQRLLSLEGNPGEYVVAYNRVGVGYFAPEEKEHFEACWDELERDPAYRPVWRDSALVLLKRSP
jgi:uncharacterized membrane protein